MTSKHVIYTLAAVGVVSGVVLQVELGGSWWVMTLMSILLAITEDMAP